MSSRPAFKKRLQDTLNFEGNNASITDLDLTRVLAPFSGASELLRRGNFRTMDELSGLALGGTHHKTVLELKELLRLVLALVNPAHHAYPGSDYRFSIQNLFEPESARIRSDVTVLSFDYDCFFAWNLFDSFRIRNQGKPIEPAEAERLSHAISSGFLNPANLDWFNEPGFCHLKLHGASGMFARPEPQTLSWTFGADDGGSFTTRHFFKNTVNERVHRLRGSGVELDAPPVLLPWEIVRDDGQLLTATEFTERVGKTWAHVGLFEFFSAL